MWPRFAPIFLGFYSSFSPLCTHTHTYTHTARFLPDRHPHRALVLAGRHGAGGPGERPRRAGEGRGGSPGDGEGRGGRRRTKRRRRRRRRQRLPPSHLLHLPSPAILGARVARWRRSSPHTHTHRPWAGRAGSPPAGLSVSQSVCPSVRQSVCPSVCLSAPPAEVWPAVLLPPTQPPADRNS